MMMMLRLAEVNDMRGSLNRISISKTTRSSYFARLPKEPHSGWMYSTP